MPPLSLFYLLLQIQQHVNRLQSIRQEPYFHSRVGVKTFCSSPEQDTVKTRATERGRAFWQKRLFQFISRCRNEVEVVGGGQLTFV